MTLPEPADSAVRSCGRPGRLLRRQRERLAALGVTPDVRPPEDWPAYFEAENAKWREVIRARNIRVQ